jgi:hypothetical protein
VGGWADVGAVRFDVGVEVVAGGARVEDGDMVGLGCLLGDEGWGGVLGGGATVVSKEGDFLDVTVPTCQSQ